MSAEFERKAVDYITERLHNTEVFKFIQSLIRESVLRIVNPDAVVRVTQLTDEELICHSMIHHFLTNNGYKAAAEVMQAECYKRFLAPDVLKETVESYDDNLVKRCLAKHLMKAGTFARSQLEHNKESNPQRKLISKADKEFERTKEALRSSIMIFADESVKKKDKLRERNEVITDEEVDGEDEEEEGVSSESKSSASSTTMESEPPSQLPPLEETPKPQLTSIKSIEFNIPQMEKSFPVQSVETLEDSPSLAHDCDLLLKGREEDTKKTAENVEELSEIESLTGIDQLLESDRSGSISF